MFTINQAWLNSILNFFRQNRHQLGDGYRGALYQVLNPGAGAEGMTPGFQENLDFHLYKLTDEGYLAQKGEWFRATAKANNTFAINHPWSTHIMQFFRANGIALGDGYRGGLYQLIYPGAGAEGMNIGFYEELDQHIFDLVDDGYLAEKGEWFRVTAKGFNQ